MAGDGPHGATPYRGNETRTAGHTEAFARTRGKHLVAKLKTTGTVHDTLTGYDFTVDTPLRPLRAMRVKCLECCCNNSAEVRRCHMTDCPLWPFRMGRNPNRAGMGSREGSFRKSSPGSINDSGSNSPEEG